MVKTDYTYVTFGFTKYHDGVICIARTKHDVYLNLEFRSETDDFIQDCVDFLNNFVGYERLSENWQEIEGIDIPYKIKTVELIVDALKNSRRRNNISF